MATSVPRHGEDLPFEIVRESWSLYALGTDLSLEMRVRSILLYLLKVPTPPGEGDGSPDVETVVPVAQTVVAIHPARSGPRRVRLPRSDYVPPESHALDTAVRHPLPFSLVRDDFNEYRLHSPGGEPVTLRTRILIDEVIRLGDLEDPLGLPLVSVGTRLETSSPGEEEAGRGPPPAPG